MPYRITTVHNIEIDCVNASVFYRGMATIIDWFLIFIYIISALTVIGLVGDLVIRNDTVSTILVIILFSPVVLYSLLFEYFMGGYTLGKKAMNIQVSDLEGGRARFGQLFVRWVFRLIDLYTFSFAVAIVFVGLTPKSQRIGDLVAGTTVTLRAPRKRLTKSTYRKVSKNHVVKFPQASLLSDEIVSMMNECMNRQWVQSNPPLVLRLADRVSSELGVTRNESPHAFLQTVLKDYNFILQRKTNANT